MQGGREARTNLSRKASDKKVAGMFRGRAPSVTETQGGEKWFRMRPHWEGPRTTWGKLRLSWVDGEQAGLAAGSDGVWRGGHSDTWGWVKGERRKGGQRQCCSE